MTLHHGDCLDVMAGMDPESVDAVVTDPPYGLSFMGKEWDKLTAVPAHTGPQWGGYGWHGSGPTDPMKSQAWHRLWAEAAYRVAKPSAYLLAFGGTRTVHRMTVAIEDAGWIIRDMLVWAYASGFPKSKASLKPAWEPIVMARKPGPLRMLDIDGCRIPLTGAEAPDGREGEATADTRYGDKVRATPGRRIRVGGGAAGSSGFAAGYERGDGFTENTAGRWPANVVLTDAVFGAESRFFLVPKADRSDREPIMGHWQAPSFDRSGDAHRTEPADPPSRVVSVWGGDEDDLTPGKKSTIPRRNVHPTVKPVDLMRHLVRLVTPPGGTVLDPFLGSGTTGIACEMEGFDWIGIEREAEYVAIAEARLVGVQKGLGLSA